MKKRIMISLLCLLYVAPVPAADILVMEFLIAHHKRLNNNLKERKDNEYLNAGLAFSVDDIVDKYNKIKQELSKATSNTYHFLVFSSEMIRAAQLTAKVIELETELIDLAITHGADHPDMLLRVKDVQKVVYAGTSQITKFTLSLFAAGINVSLATQKQRHQFSSYIINQLELMYRSVYTNLIYIRYVIEANLPVNYKALISDEDCKSIAEKIIEQFKKR